MRKLCLQTRSLVLLLVCGFAAPLVAADNQLTPAEREAGWLLLFDGESLSGWLTSSEKPSERPVEDGALNPHRCGGYMLIHEKTWENYTLSLDFKISPKCNSGVFIRTWPLTPRPGKDVGFNGIEIAIDDTQGAGFHDTGAVYDLVKPAKNAMKPAGQWNCLVITCDRNLIDVELNGEAVTQMDLDEWTEPNRRPDGSQHKFDVAFKDHARRGYIGLQDHGADCWFKNIKLLPLKSSDPQQPWIAAMREVHERFDGQPGTFAQFGDSITVSLAFWAPLSFTPGGLSPDLEADLKLVKEHQRPECWRDWRGPQFGNEGRMTIRWAHENVDAWLEKLNPEVAVILFGTNDLTELEREEYETKTREVVQKCLENGTVAILTTPPPRHGLAERAAEFAETVRKLARELKVPLIDYHAEILQRRPDDWDGAAPKFKDAPGDEYNVPTLIARDGVHPSNPRDFQDYSDRALSHNGFALRNALTLQKYAEVIREALPRD